jgi:Dyp-type peroxidase family
MTTDLDQLPLRGSEEIQGNILAGFNKDHQTFLFLRFSDSDSGRAWLTELLPRISRTREVASFNQRFSEARKASGGDDPVTLKATWVNVALTNRGILTLAPIFSNDLTGFSAFQQGPAARAAFLGDTGKSDPTGWVVGQAPIDALLSIAADQDSDMLNEIQQQMELISRHNVILQFMQKGDTLPGEAAGHEHFGFKDGISQPGVRGFDFPDASNPNQVLGHKGSEMINPGEFILGYERQGMNGIGDDATPTSIPPNPIPDWMSDGSFLVFRRLTQDVPGFWAQVLRNAEASGRGISPDLLAAKLVGRWRSGTPIDLAPNSDDRDTRDPATDNDFRFNDPGVPGSKDPEGLRCPRFAHIRKVYPRDHGFGDFQRRIMRRGIPFGQPFDPSAGRGQGVDGERGLLFVAYMASIEDQFEFLQSVWANPSGFPEFDSGPDPVIGQSGESSNNTLKLPGTANTPLHFERFVNTTGAAYAFAPSISTLRRIAQGGAVLPAVETINGHAVGFAFLRFFRLHPDIGQPTDDQQGDIGGFQDFQNARLTWTGTRIRVDWNTAQGPLPDWLEGQNPNEFEV